MRAKDRTEKDEGGQGGREKRLNSPACGAGGPGDGGGGGGGRGC